MELHSYAKRRTTPKKWSNEQRRILIDARIAYENLFAQTPNGSVLPWKKILTLAKLDDYNVFFVRKQWSNMVAKYKQYKINRFGHINTINEKMIEEISKEWEFFGPIHDYMMLKSRKLHSYALQYREEPSLEPFSNSNSTQSSTECINIYSSDTNDIPISSHKMLMIETASTAQNTDHDSYSKKWVEQQNLLATKPVEEPTAEMDTKEDAVVETHTQVQVAAENEVIIMNTTQSQPTQPMDVQSMQESVEPIHKEKPKVLDNKTHNHLSERDRYYRHKRRFNRRFERRFDAILQVVGKVVKAEYPSIDVSPLMQVANAAVELGSQLNGQIFSSGDEFDDESDEIEDDLQNKNKNEKPTTSTHDTSQSNL